MKSNRDKIENILNKLSISSPPIPLDQVVKLFSLEIIYYPKFPKHISGTLIQEENLNVIGINKNDPPTRQRFSIAHELGHYVLGHQTKNKFHDDRDEYSNKEIEANKFASELLMPTKMLEKDIKDKPYDIPDLAKRYNVSEQAMSVRLLNSNLLDKIKIPK